MFEFLYRHYSFITNFVEFLAAFTGVFCYRKYSKTETKYFIWFLIMIASFELLCSYVSFVRPNRALSFLIGTKFEKSHWLGTIYWDVGAVLFFVFYFYKILKSQFFKNIIKYSGYGFFLFSVVTIALNWQIFFIQFLDELSVLGALIILLCSVFYFIEVLLSDKVLTFYKSINFYISAAIFVWWLVITPLTFYNVYFTYEIGKSYLDKDFVFLRFMIFLITNLFMYLTFSFAFIWCKPQND